MLPLRAMKIFLKNILILEPPLQDHLFFLEDYGSQNIGNHPKRLIQCNVNVILT